MPSLARTQRSSVTVPPWKVVPASWAGLTLIAVLAGCATRTGVVVATEDRAERYVGARSKGAGSDTVSLT